MTTYSKPLTPEQAKKKHPRRFKSTCNAAYDAAYALRWIHGVSEERYVVWRGDQFYPVAHLLPDETVLATFGQKATP